MKKASQSRKNSKGSAAMSLKVDYIKSALFRVTHADGIVGGVTPQGFIQMVVFSERFPIPTQMEYKLAPDGKLGDEVPEGRISRNAVVREMDIAVTMSPDVAYAVHKWLGGHLEKLEAHRKKLER